MHTWTFTNAYIPIVLCSQGYVCTYGYTMDCFCVFQSQKPRTIDALCHCQWAMWCGEFPYRSYQASSSVLFCFFCHLRLSLCECLTNCSWLAFCLVLILGKFDCIQKLCTVPSLPCRVVHTRRVTPRSWGMLQCTGCQILRHGQTVLHRGYPQDAILYSFSLHVIRFFILCQNFSFIR